MFTTYSRSHLAAWLAAHREQAIDAIALALGIESSEVLSRLRVRLRDLTIASALAPARPRRRRGRPRRQIDRERVLASLRRHGCKHREIACETQVPRTTLSRFLPTIPPHAWIYGEKISERHGELLAKSGVSVDVVRARGYVSAPDGLVIPIWNERGVKVWAQTRFDMPKDRRHRYQNGPDAAATIDVNPAARQLVLDPERPLYVTEGPRKADAATSRGLACVAFTGVRMLCLDRERWQYIGVEGREVRIVFDADAAYKPDVGAAERELSDFLRSLGARVRIVRLPGCDTGLDDFLAAGHAEPEMLALMRGASGLRRY